MLAAGYNKEYLPIEGLDSFRKATVQLLLGADHPAIKDSKVAVVQALSGTGSLRLGAAFIARWMKGTTVYISNPTWGNHRCVGRGLTHGFEHGWPQSRHPCLVSVWRNMQAGRKEGRLSNSAAVHSPGSAVLSARTQLTGCQTFAGTSLGTRVLSGSTTGETEWGRLLGHTARTPGWPSVQYSGWWLCRSCLHTHCFHCVTLSVYTHPARAGWRVCGLVGLASGMCGGA